MSDASGSPMSWDMVDSGDESRSLSNGAAADEDQERFSRPLPSDHAREMQNVGSLEADAEARANAAFSHGGVGGGGGDVHHHHQHFYRKHKYIVKDTSKHFHINHVHHHHYHQHSAFPFAGYNGWNGNGNVRSLQLEPYRSLPEKQDLFLTFGCMSIVGLCSKVKQGLKG